MTVKEFVEGYKRAKINDKTKNEFLKKHIVRYYIPYLEKITECKHIVDISFHITHNDIKVFKANTPNMHLMYNVKLIDLYTDIDIEKELKEGVSIDEVYDVLKESGAVIDIIMNISEEEVAEFKSIMDATLQDLYDNEYSSTAALIGILDSIKLVGKSIGDGIINVLEENIGEIGEIENGER